MAHFAIPSHILVGKDALPSAVPYLKTYGNRAFIVTGKHVGKSPMMEQLKKTLETAEIAYYVFDGITGEPTDKMIEEGLAQYKKTGCQFIIGIGGGSPLDSAKAIAAMAVNEGKTKENTVQALFSGFPLFIQDLTSAVILAISAYLI